MHHRGAAKYHLEIRILFCSVGVVGATWSLLVPPISPAIRPAQNGTISKSSMWCYGSLLLLLLGIKFFVIFSNRIGALSKFGLHKQVENHLLREELEIEPAAEVTIMVTEVHGRGRSYQVDVLAGCGKGVNRKQGS